jgi:TolA-binding protein
MKLPLALLVALAVWLPGGEPRLMPDPAALENLPQAERWLLLEAQEAYGKGRYAAAAIAWEKFGRKHPDSALWAFAGWRRAEALRLDKKQDGAIAALKELIDLAPEAAETAEALLLLAECQAEAGLVAEAVATAKDLLARFPASSAALPARLVQDDGLVNQAKQQNLPADRLRSQRLVVLGPIGERIDDDPRNRRAQEQGLRRLVELALAGGELPRVAALVKTVLASPQARELAEVAVDAGREVMKRGWSSGDDAIAGQVAAVLWPDAQTLAVERGRLRLEWLQWVRREPAEVAKAQGVEPKALQERCLADMAELAGSADTAARSMGRNDGRREALAWLAAAARLSAGQDVAAAEQLPVSIGRPLVRRDAGRWWELGERAAVEPGKLLAILPRLAEGRERRLAEMDLKAWTAQRLRTGEPALAAANEAIAIAIAFEGEDPERAGDYIALQAELLRRVCRQHDRAIDAYARLNRPPSSDFAIAETLAEKGDHQAAAAKLGEIAAIHAGKDAGGEALVRLGVMLHRNLKDKARAVLVLRQVCDEHPNTKHYGEAHRYLQSELGVTYTGGGGKRQPK